MDITTEPIIFIIIRPELLTDDMSVIGRVKLFFTKKIINKKTQPSHNLRIITIIQPSQSKGFEIDSVTGYYFIKYLPDRLNNHNTVVCHTNKFPTTPHRKTIRPIPR